MRALTVISKLLTTSDPYITWDHHSDVQIAQQLAVIEVRDAMQEGDEARGESSLENP